MKDPSPAPRASHVNFGTSVPTEELPWPEHEGPVMRVPRLHIETEERSTVTRFGGLALVEKLCRRFRFAQVLDSHIRVLKLHLPYHESDHILAQALNLYVGGTCIEDMMLLQKDEAVLRMFGACRLPDPTTAGDFLRRFDRDINPGALPGLRRAGDELQERVWRALPRAERRRRKRQMRAIDIDSHVKPLCGDQKQGADFSYNGKWSYHPFIISEAQAGECLAVRNRPGNAYSSNGVASVLEEVLLRFKKHCKVPLVRGDSAFDEYAIRQVCHKHGAYFAFVSESWSNLKKIAETLPDSAYRPFHTRASRQQQHRSRKPGFKSRSKKRNRRTVKATERDYKQMHLKQQWVAEVPYRHVKRGRERPTYRLVIRRQLIENTGQQQRMFESYRYRFVITNLPAQFSTEDVVDETYQRCDQEKVIEQMGSGLASWRMPVAEFDGNAAWLEIARLAWNMGKWIAQLALPREVIRWQWKRFRLHYVLVAAQLIKRARRMWVRLLGARRTVDPLLWAFDTL